MSTQIGHFEILSEIAKSATGVVYKANDLQTSQTVALEAISLPVFGERAAELETCLLEEVDATKGLNHSNLLPVYRADKIDDRFCAAMEYIQGNSIATMLAHKEGFSIWDLLDIGRQVCSGLDHAHSRNIVHYALEPAKIMCGWDGTVRILGYGISSVGKFSAQIPGLPSILHYMSPEQVRNEIVDARSNLFSLGAIFYEMVTDRKAFDGEDPESVRRSVTEGEVVAPLLVNPKVHPVLSDLIVKALAKDPAARYQNGKELLDDLEKCKETKPQAAKQAAPPVKPPAVPVPVQPPTQPKFTGAVSQPAAATTAAAKASVSAAGWTGAAAAPARAGVSQVKTSLTAPKQPSVSLSASPVLDEPTFEAPQAEAPKIAVDPLMSGGGPARAGSVSFSEMTELPPLKEVYIAPPPPPPPAFEQQAAHAPSPTVYEQEPEKPKVQPRVVAQKAMKEIKSVPPSLVVYSIAGAAVLILIIAVALVFHVNSLNNDGDTPRPAAVATQQPAPQPSPSQPVQAEPAPAAEAAEPQASAPADEAEPEPAPAHATAARGRNARKKSVAAPVLAPGQMTIDSTPQGAQVQIDGKTDPSWTTPVTLSGLAAGQHSISLSKPGYATDTRTVAVASGSKSSIASRLAQVVATLAVSSNPAGANVYIDGKNTGKLTPAQVSVDKGQHVVLVRKSGYIDETTNAQFALGQTVSFSPALRPLGNVDDIRTVGKMKKLFGGKETRDMGTVSIKTQPKGAQVAVNQHMLEKDSPVDFMLDPGNYIVDITMSGYAPIHKVVTVDKGGKVVIDEALQHE